MNWVGWLVFAVCLGLTATVRLGGASLLRTHRADALHDAGDDVAGADRVAHLLEEPRLVVAAIGIVTFALGTGAVAAGTWAVLGVWDDALAVVAVVVLGVAVLVVGDLLPRSLGRRRPGALAYRLAGMLGVAVRLGAAADDLIAAEEPDEEPEDADDEERIDDEERELIESVLEFSDTVVREVMVPRTDLVTITAEAGFDEALDVIVETGFSRVPVVGDDVDDVVGVLYARDLLRMVDDGTTGAVVGEFMREPMFIPETKRIPDLLRVMQAEKTHLVVVVDEFGGTAGIATIEDLLEELVGEIADEFDDDEVLITHQADGSLQVDARLAVYELSELLEVELPDEEWDTVGGLLLALSGRIPHIGEVFSVEGVSLAATRIQGRRIAQVRVWREP